MVLVGFECDESFKKAILKKSKASGLTLSEYLRRLIAQDLGLDRDVQYMTRREVEELIDLKLLKSGFKGDDVAKEDLNKIKKPLKQVAESTGFKEDLSKIKETSEPDTEATELEEEAESFKEETVTEEPELKELPSDVLDDKVQAGLLFLAYCFENGKEPTKGSIYGAVDLKTKEEKDAFEAILRNHGIELSSEGKNLKLYRLELREKVEELLDSKRRLSLAEYRKKRSQGTVVQQESTSIDSKLKTVLELILSELEKGKEPTVQEIASKVDMDPRQLGIMLKQLYNLDSQNVRRDGKRGRRYLLEQKDEIRKILESC